MKRTHRCDELGEKHVGEEVILSGWIHRRRNLGSLAFIDLRDLYGKTQLLFDPTTFPSLQPTLSSLRLEWVISVSGIVKKRTEANPQLATGAIEIEVREVQVLSEAKTPPFTLFGEDAVHEDLRLQYRFLDIRRGEIAHNLVLRHQAMLSVRNTLSSMGFFEITTPILGKTTPEGARDYLVPSRIHPGSFYALPQSPQIFKQLLMLSGMDRYFQIATCFRDEDLRKDRQPEFTQIDIELSFSDQEAFFPMIESLMKTLFSEVKKTHLPLPFPRLSHEECLNLYGTDKPDTRFGMTFVDVTPIFASLNTPFLQEKFDQGALAKGFVVKKGAVKSRKEIESYLNFVQGLGLPTLTWIKRKEGSFASNAKKLFSEQAFMELATKLTLEEGDLALIGIEMKPSLHQALDHLRRKIGEEEKLIDPKTYAFLWVTDFPLFTQDPSTKHLASEHHPFTSPHLEDLHLLDSDPKSVRSLAYDLVLNGFEIGSGSQRIHDANMQKKIFSKLNLQQAEIEEKFGFFLHALQYGAPPHLGIALGLDRIMMILCGADNIREVIAFPKTQNASDLLLQSPSKADTSHLRELGLLS